MREILWGTYRTIAYKSFYYHAYQDYVERRVFWSRAVCAVVSILSVLVWSISKSLPVLWACLIALAQLAQTLLGFLPWEKQASSLHYLVPALDELVVDATRDWLRLECSEEDNNELSSTSAEYDRRFHEIETRYISGVWFPKMEKFRDEAEIEWDSFKTVRFNCPKGDETLASQNSEPEAAEAIEASRPR